MNTDKEKSNVWLKRRGETENLNAVFTKVFPTQKSGRVDDCEKFESGSLLVDLNKYREGSFRVSNRSKVFLGLSVFALVSFVLFNIWYIDYTKPKFYCTEKHLKGSVEEDHCIPCPQDSICKNGSVVECLKEKILIKNECIENSAVELLKKSMRVKLEQILAESNGNIFCGYSPENSKFISLEKARNKIFKLHEGIPEAKEALKRLIDEFTASSISYPEHIEFNLYNSLINDDLDNKYLRSKKSSIPLACKILSISELHCWPIFILSVLIIVGIWRVNELYISNENAELAENLYKCVLFLLKSEPKVHATGLVSFLPDKLSSSRKQKILLIMERVLGVDKQLDVKVEEAGKYYIAQ
jgi:hypothetical protein